MDRDEREELIQHVANELNCSRAEVLQQFTRAVMDCANKHPTDTGTVPTGDEILLAELLAGKQDFMIVGAVLSSADFALPAHKRIFQRMADLYDRREAINRVTVANELMMHGELESCGGLSYLVKLDDHLILGND